MSGPSPLPQETSSLADELAKLEEIVRRLEGDDVELDAALALFEEGVARLRAARERLASAEVKVRPSSRRLRATSGLLISMADTAAKASATDLLVEAREAIDTLLGDWSER